MLLFIILETSIEQLIYGRPHFSGFIPFGMYSFKDTCFASETTPRTLLRIIEYNMFHQELSAIVTED